MRRIFQYLNDVEKREALDELRRDIAELDKESHNSEYPRVVRDAIEETLVRYRRDADFLESQLALQESANARPG